MKIIEFSKDNEKRLQEFMPTIIQSGTRPAIYIGLDDNSDPILCMSNLTWKELAYIKMCLDMYITQDWMGKSDE